VNWITFTRGSLGLRWSLPDGASRFQYPGVGKVAWRYTALAALFFVPGSLAAVPCTAHVEKMPIGYPNRKNGLGAKYTKAAGIFPAVTVLNLN